MFKKNWFLCVDFPTLDKTGGTVRKRKWTDQDKVQMEISETC
jgi:hypothetical protein